MKGTTFTMVRKFLYEEFFNEHIYDSLPPDSSTSSLIPWVGMLA